MAKTKRKRLIAKASAGSRFYLKYTSKNKVMLPVSPEELKVTSPFGVNRIDVAHRGEITQIGFRQLREFEFSSFFPKNFASYCVTTSKTLKSPESYRKTIEGYRSKRQPIWLIVTDLKISVKVVIERFDYEFKGGEVGDMYYTIKLVEYKEPPSTKVKKKKKKPAAKKKKKKTAGKKGKRPSSSNKFSVKKGQTHKVVSGENLSKISQRYYGTQTKWRYIYDLNRKIIGANPNKIYPGQKLVIRKK